MTTIGENLKQERLRLNLNQEQFAELGGVRKRAQISYEQGERVPDADYLSGVAAAGVDVQFVLTGKLSTSALSDEENELISGYRGLDSRGRAGVLGTIRGLTAAESPRTTFKGEVGQVVQGDQEVNAPFTISVGSGKKNKKQ
jgi:transcriptional regulator with XRE-family HTH domain